MNITGACTYFLSWCTKLPELSQSTMQALSTNYGSTTFTHLAMVLPSDIGACGAVTAQAILGAKVACMHVVADPL